MMSKPAGTTHEHVLPQTASGRRAARRTNWWIGLALVVLVVSAYWQVWDFGLLIYDDDLCVRSNPHVQAGLNAETIRWAFTTSYANFRMPLAWLSWMLDRDVGRFALGHGVELGPDNAGVFHLTNVAMHLASTLLLFALLTRLTGRRWRSAFVAALFAVHPLHVESVAWVVERKDVLSGVFFMLTMLAYTSYARRPCIRGYALLVAALVLGLMAKPMLVTLPAVMLLADFWPLGRFGSLSELARGRWRLVAEKLPLAAIVLAASAVAFVAQGEALGSLEVYSPGMRIANALVQYVVYLQKTVWPGGLAVFYPHPERTLPVWLVVACGALLVSITYLAVRSAPSRPYLTVGWLWYAITLLPVSGLVQVGAFARADRFTYLPLIGIFIIIAWGVPDLANRLGRRARRMVPGLAIAAIVVLAGVCYRQVSYWRDDISLFTHALAVTDDNVVAYNDLGLAYAGQGKIGRAMWNYKKALEISPDFGSAHANLGLLLTRLGRFDEAIAQFRAIIADAPDDAGPYNNIGVALSKQGRYREAIEYFTKAIERDPGYIGAHGNRGIAQVALGEPEEALDSLKSEIAINPYDAPTHYALGLALSRLGRRDEALASFSRALSLDPELAPAHVGMGSVLVAEGRSKDAIPHYREALRLDPRSAESANALAWILATHPDPRVRDGKQAVRLAELACRLTTQADASALDTLAAAYARDGRFGDATRTAERAIRMAETSGHPDVARQVRERLKLYRSGLAYTENPR